MPKTSWGKWKLIKELPSGGQGSIYLVESATGSPSGEFILKRLRDPSRIQRFKAEFAALIALSHSNIVRVVDSDWAGERPYIVTEYCKLDSLDANFDSLGSLIARLELFARICGPIGYAHNRGYVHRDIKPANIFLRDPASPVIGDFGLCYHEDEPRMTASSEVVGARWYTAPELEDGRLDNIVPSADVYSLGKLLYWILRGTIFAREKYHEQPYNLVEIHANTPLAVDYQIVHDSLFNNSIREDAGRRFKDATEMASGTREAITLIHKRRQILNRGSTTPAGIVTCAPLIETSIASPSGSLVAFCARDGASVHLTTDGNAIDLTHASDAQTQQVALQMDANIRWRDAIAPLAIDEQQNVALVIPHQHAKHTEPGAFKCTVYRFAAGADTIGSPRLLHLASQQRYIGVALCATQTAVSVTYGDARHGSPEILVANVDDDQSASIPIDTASSYPMPLAYDHEQTVHLSFAEDVAGGKRQLRHIQVRNGAVCEDTLVATPGTPQFSAHIALALRAGHIPTILTNASTETAGIRFYVCESGEWVSLDVNLSDVLSSYGLRGSFGGPNQMVLTEDGTHLALSNNMTILYVHLDGDYNILDHKCIAGRLVGMGREKEASVRVGWVRE